MKLPISWLKDYVDVAASPEKLAEDFTMSGTKVESLEKKGDAAVIELEITTNRPDCLSILGLAAEVAALGGKKVRFPKIAAERKPEKGAVLPKIVIEDRKGCPKYTARLLQDVSIAPSPADVQRKLELVGARPVNNAVDATNFVLFEMGQPLHAFDYGKIKGGTVIVRRARKDEKFLAINGVEYALDEETLVIADAEGPVALAGVMGGKSTEVTSSTKNILLESAYFDPIRVRRAARKYKLVSDSSYRFERGVDPECVAEASARARDLILEWAGGREVSGLLEKDSFRPCAPKTIVLRSDYLKKTLGMSVPVSRAASILKKLNLEVKPHGRDGLTVVPPSSRRDIREEADLAEEVLRIEGFEKIPVSIPTTRCAAKPVCGKKAKNALELKKTLAAFGLNEIITYSLVSGKALGDSRLGPAHRIVNPVSAEQEFLRPMLLPGMLGAVLHNLHRKAEVIRFFELGNIYHDGVEETALGLCFCGRTAEHWKAREKVSFYDLKGAAEALLDSLKMPFEWKEAPFKPPFSNQAELWAAGKKMGFAAALDPATLARWDIPQEVFFAEIVLEGLLESDLHRRRGLRVKPLNKFPSVRRDVALLLDENIPASRIEALVRETSPYVREVRLFDEYAGKNIPAGKRSLAFSISYEKETGTFSEDEITELQAQVGNRLKNALGAEFR